MTDANLEAPSVSKLAGQLLYMFEDDRALLDAPVAQLRQRLALEDRIARARHKYPNDNDAEIQARLTEFDDRIPEADVAAAAEEARRRLGD
jgi:hypothetical protein